jgi:hypothetical protein
MVLPCIGRPPSQAEVRSRPAVPARNEAYCRLHEGYEEAARQAAGMAGSTVQVPAVKNKPGCRLHETGSGHSSPDGGTRNPHQFVFLKHAFAKHFYFIVTFERFCEYN